MSVFDLDTGLCVGCGYTKVEMPGGANPVTGGPNKPPRFKLRARQLQRRGFRLVVEPLSC